MSELAWANENGENNRPATAFVVRLLSHAIPNEKQAFCVLRSDLISGM